MAARTALRGRMRAHIAAAIAVMCLLAWGCGGTPAQSPASRTASTPATPLASWNDGPAKTAITDFVAAVTTAGGPSFVPVAERIAVFDNDGTLWSEQPIYTEFAFALDRVKAEAANHPDWKTREPFKSVLEDNMAGLAASGAKGLGELIMATHTGMSTDEFAQTAAAWLESARHATRNRPYTELIYQPMLEVLDYLRAHDFKTFIVSGGTAEFMRPFTERVYGVPPEQVVGTTFVTRLDASPGRPLLLMRQPAIEFIDDGPGKPVGINKFIGRRPIAAFGNSDGDLQMLQWTTAGDGRRLAVLVHHTDADREWAYDRQSHIGKLDRALDDAGPSGWTVVDMQRDWRVVYPFER